jgi:hypothetical protein
MLISTVLGRFVIPVYYVLGERIIAYFNPPAPSAEPKAQMQNDDKSPESLHI